jgi:hypothetical protein
MYTVFQKRFFKIIIKIKFEFVASNFEESGVWDGVFLQI